jgi:xylulokinase
MAILLGIDLGTSGIKILAVNEKGEILASASEAYPLIQPQAGWAEQNTEDWWQGFLKAVKQIIADPAVKTSDIKALSLSGQMHGSVFLDKDGKVIRNPLLWNDTRTHRQCEYITKTVGEKKLLEMVGNPALEGFTLPKLIWLRDNEPENYKKVKTLFLPKDYIVYRLTGKLSTEMSDAAGSLLLDVKNRKWSEDLCGALDIDPGILPPVIESTDIAGIISSKASAETGLPIGVKVIGGGADNACGAVGNGIVEEGIVLASIGSSGVVLAHSNKMEYDPHGRIHSFNHSVPHNWYLMGVTLSAGLSMSWMKNNLFKTDYDTINSEAASVHAGSKGLIFLPYISGERTPHRDPMARGAFIGLSGIHEQKHMMRSVFEGVSFALKDSLELIKGLGVKPKQIRVTGGGAKSNLWRQILADVFNKDVVTMQADEGPAYGAALIAGVGAGTWSDLPEAVQKTVRVGKTTKANPKDAEAYDKIYPLFKSLYQSLKNDFRTAYELNN